MSKTSKPAPASKPARPSKEGYYHGIRILDPVVRPKGVTVSQIRRAVREAVKASRANPEWK